MNHRITLNSGPDLPDVEDWLPRPDVETTDEYQPQ